MTITENHIESYLANLKSEIVSRFQATICRETFESDMYILEVQPSKLFQDEEFCKFSLEKENEFVISGFGAELCIWDENKLKIFRGEIFDESDTPTQENHWNTLKTYLQKSQTWLVVGLAASLLLFLNTTWRYAGVEERLDQLQADLAEKSTLIQEKDQKIGKLQTDYESLKQQTQNKGTKTVILAKNDTKFEANIQNITKQWLDIENCQTDPKALGTKSIGIDRSTAVIKIQKYCGNKFSCFWTDNNKTHMGIGTIEIGDKNNGSGQIVFAHTTQKFEISKEKVQFQE